MRFATGLEPINVIDKLWVRSFTQYFRIVERRRTEKNQLREQQISKSNREMAYHLGQVNQQYENRRNQNNFNIYHYETNVVFE